MSGLISPLGGKLVNLLAGPERRYEIDRIATDLPSVFLAEEELCDLELLATGAFSPLDRFMGSRDVRSVLAEGRLPDGTLFPIPVILQLHDVGSLEVGSRLALRDANNRLLGTMVVDEIFPIDADAMMLSVIGSADPAHPYSTALKSKGAFVLSGKPELISLPTHRNFSDLRMTPEEVRSRLGGMGLSDVAAFQTRNPIHRAHEALLNAALERTEGLLIHPVVGPTKAGDIDAGTRVRTYRALLRSAFDDGRTLLSVLPLAMRFAGPREAVWHAIIRRNYGANRFIVGRDHASPGNDSNGRPFFDPRAARELLETHAEELGISVLAFDEFLYCPEDGRYREVPTIPPTMKTASISGTEAREKYLASGVPLPEWFTRPEVARILTESVSPKHRRGFCIWLTGLSAAGKTTIADALTAALEDSGRTVTLLDGDVVRRNLSKGLGFSPEDRDTNIRRIGFVAAEVAKHGGAAICAAISPFRRTRDEVRAYFEPGAFIEVFVDTPLEECEKRDPKGMYRLARQGKISDFTGIDSPYEPPTDCEIRIDGSTMSARVSVDAILRFLKGAGFLE